MHGETGTAGPDTVLALRLPGWRRALAVAKLVVLVLTAVACIGFAALTLWGAALFAVDLRPFPTLFTLFFVACGLFGFRDALRAVARQWRVLTHNGGAGLVLSAQGLQLTAEGATVGAPWGAFTDISLRDLGSADANVLGFPIRRRREGVVAQMDIDTRERLSAELAAQGVKGVSPSTLVLSIPPALIEPKLLMRMIGRFWQPAT